MTHTTSDKSVLQIKRGDEDNKRLFKRRGTILIEEKGNFKQALKEMNQQTGAKEVLEMCNVFKEGRKDYLEKGEGKQAFDVDRRVKTVYRDLKLSI